MDFVLIAQKKVDQKIPDAEKKKVLRARKLLNEFKIYQGERILKDLVKDHPYEAYYHEALVQIQRQVLSQVQMAGYALPSFETPSMNDTLSTEDTLENYATHDSKSSNIPVLVKDTSEWNGLDIIDRAEDKKLKRTAERKKIKAEEEEDAPLLKEAEVTIDSSLLKEEIDTSEIGISKKEKKIDKSLSRQLKAVHDLVQIPYEGYKADLIQNARRATLFVEEADSASAYLRYFLVDTADLDIHLSSEAKDLYTAGIEEINAKEIPTGISLFQKALAIEPEYFKAHLALGDAYYAIGKDTNAMRSYLKAAYLQPKLPEPLEKLSMLYYNWGNFEEAAAYCIKAIEVYPHVQYFSLLKLIVNKTGKNFSRQWIRREVYPLNTGLNYFELLAKEKTPWWQYQAADAEVHGYYDTLGIVRPNEKTNERYLEVYAWKQMLADTKKEFFPFARAMNDIGFIDCYLLISCFHHDLYGQFADLAKREPKKIEDYFYILINWEDKKFDKLREKVAPISEKKNSKEDKKPQKK